MFKWLKNLVEYLKDMYEFVKPEMYGSFFDYYRTRTFGLKYFVHLAIITLLCVFAFKMVRVFIYGDVMEPYSFKAAWRQSNFWYRDPKYYVHIFITIGSGWLLLFVLNWAWFRLFSR